MSSQQAIVVGLGELLWDMFPSGPLLGGAPANFASHTAQLGANAALVSCVGQDELGEQAIRLLAQRDVAGQGIGRSHCRTGTVEVSLDALGVPTYNVLTDVAWDHLTWSEAIADLAASAGAVCFGTLGQRSPTSRQTIERFLQSTPPETLRIFDINLRAPFYANDVILKSLELANVLKLNDEELPVVASVCGITGSQTEQMQQLASRYELKAVALTCGSDGATLLRGEEICQRPAVKIEVEDTVGAGDAFTATLAMGLIAGHDLSTISSTATRVAAYVCSQAGAVPLLPQEFAAW